MTAVLARRASQQRVAQEASTALEHRARLDIYSNPSWVRKTSIICTIGPDTNSVEMLTELRRSGMNIVRLNFSHGSHEFHKSIIDNTRKSVQVNPSVGRVVAIALDTKGPEIRTGMLKGGAREVSLELESVVTVTVDPAFEHQCDASLIYIDYANLIKTVSVGDLIFLDDGLISLQVESKEETSLQGKVMNAGMLGSRKGVNLPDAKIDLPALSDKDKGDLRFGVEQGVDMIFASFVRKAEDIHEIRQFLGEEGKKIKIIAKIENKEGLDNFDQILQVTDGVMVARGDLGIEIAPEKVFVAQKMIMAKCNLAGKPVICATQMLESMIKNPRPTRAETSDVANAVLDGADCVMLSGETAKGLYPLEAVQIMSSICQEAESATFYKSLNQEMMKMMPVSMSSSVPIALSITIAASHHRCAAIITLTATGDSARLIAMFRPRCPVLVVSRDPQVLRQIHLYRGCFPLHYASERLPSREHDIEVRHQFGMEQGKETGFLRSGDSVVLAYGWQLTAGHNLTDFRIAVVP